MEEKHYKELSEKLDTIIKLLAMQSLEDKKGREAISILANLGFQPKDIATMIGTTPNTVRVALSEMRKKK
jgi:DNA-directed RNA polymerase specialized sigma24 family protein